MSNIIKNSQEKAPPAVGDPDYNSPSIGKSEFPSVPGKAISSDSEFPAVPGKAVDPTDQAEWAKKQNTYSKIPVVSEAIQSVKVMQQQILDLHSALSKDDAFAWKGQTSVSAEQAGTDPFLNFMFANYVQGDTTQHDFGQAGYAEKDIREKGKDIKAQPPAKPIPGTKTETTPGFAKSLKGKETYDLRAILNSIQAVGRHTSKGENVPDGIWGPRTNAALKNIYIFADAMLNLKSELGIISESYTPAELNEFRSLIPTVPPTEKPIKNQSERAKQLSQHIAKVKSLFPEFKEKVFEHPEYKSLIQQSKKFPTKIDTKSKPVQLDDHQKNIYNNYMKKSPNKEIAFVNKSLKSAPGIPLLDESNNYGLKLNDISNLENFKKFLKTQQILVDNQPATLNNQNIMKAYQKIKEIVDAQKV